MLGRRKFLNELLGAGLTAGAVVKVGKYPALAKDQRAAPLPSAEFISTSWGEDCPFVAEMQERLQKEPKTEFKVAFCPICMSHIKVSSNYATKISVVGV